MSRTHKRNAILWVDFALPQYAAGRLFKFERAIRRLLAARKFVVTDSNRQAHACLRLCFLAQAVYDNNIAEDDHLYEDVSFMTRTRCTCEVSCHFCPASDPAIHNFTCLPSLPIGQLFSLIYTPSHSSVPLFLCQPSSSTKAPMGRTTPSRRLIAIHERHCASQLFVLCRTERDIKRCSGLTRLRTYVRDVSANER
jgi:hypothetical protein